MQTRTKNTGRTRTKTRKTRKNKKVTLRVRRKRQQLKKTLKGGWSFFNKESNKRYIIDVFYLPPNAQDDYKLPCFTGNLVLNVNPKDPTKDSLVDNAHEKPIELIGKFDIINYLVNNYIGVNQKNKYKGKKPMDVSYKNDIIPDVEFFYTKVLKMKGVIGVDNRNQLTKRCSSIDKKNLSGVVPNPNLNNPGPNSPNPNPNLNEYSPGPSLNSPGLNSPNPFSPS